MYNIATGNKKHDIVNLSSSNVAYANPLLTVFQAFSPKWEARENSNCDCWRNIVDQLCGVESLKIVFLCGDYIIRICIPHLLSVLESSCSVQIPLFNLKLHEYKFESWWNAAKMCIHLYGRGIILDHWSSVRITKGLNYRLAVYICWQYQEFFKKNQIKGKYRITTLLTAHCINEIADICKF